LKGDAALISLYVPVLVVVILLQSGEPYRRFFTSQAAEGLRKRGILLQRQVSLDRVARIDTACLDKTGVLTDREMEVERIHFRDEAPVLEFFISDSGVAGLTKTALALCNDVLFPEKLAHANPVDRALVRFAARNGAGLAETSRKYRRIFDKPFLSEDRYMAAGFEREGRAVYFAKGDPDVVLGMCESYATSEGGECGADFDFRSWARERMHSINRAGRTPIAVAFHFGEPTSPPARYTFLCIVELDNPVRPGVAGVLEELRRRGIRPVMLTGDRAEAAAKVGAETGISEDPQMLMTGRQIERMELAEVARQLEHVSLLARLKPSQKAVLVRLLQGKGRRVAMVGDGPNDALALKVSDVGVSFTGFGSPVATRTASVLIGELSDLTALIDAARNAALRLNLFKVLRAGVTVGLWIALYALTVA
jgi:Ca2+-transporting ATPase